VVADEDRFEIAEVRRLHRPEGRQRELRRGRRGEGEQGEQDRQQAAHGSLADGESRAGV
jgi:hypothetical protein